MKHLIFFLIILGGYAISAQKISDRKIERKLSKIEAFNNAHIAISISSLEGDKSQISFQDNKYMTPASNIKLLTFLAASQKYDSLPVLYYNSINDSVMQFKSSGYPLLFHPFYPDDVLANFFKKKQYFKYVAPNKAFDGLGEGWSWDDYNYYHAAQKSSFPIYGNVVEGTIVNGKLRTIPESWGLKSKMDTTKTAFLRLQNKNKFLINPKQWKKGDTLYRPFITSDSLFVKLLEQATGNSVKIHSQLNKNIPWKTLYSQNEDLIFKALLQDSDNGIAEALLLMLSETYFGEMQTKKVIDTIQRQWEPWLPDPIEWVDGSGVSRYNMLTPRTLVRVLQEIHKTIGWEIIQAYFPKGGTSKTLKKHEGTKSYAKTGTLRHNHNLSGYLVNPKKKIYVFSIMVNHHTASTSEVRRGISELLQWFDKKLN